MKPQERPPWRGWRREREVEGETLLIVKSEDQASVDLSHDQSGDSLNSDEGDVSWREEQLSYFCDKCQKWIPASKSFSFPLLCQFLREVLRSDHFLHLLQTDNVQIGSTVMTMLQNILQISR
ncbi:hypothetical protein J1605_017788 [Eschrichtius robustus]|uniref:Uncharacterized protein n=1 Tax=Eschrichtius robustus TaxID=9764 RepID=A0AB34I124_ESCRO|nr:hypothetical protein J1605_017788 [Eschrichtius robustus]